MSSLILSFYLVWFLGVVKSILFWIYLWQLKEYHIGRFIDHFRTHKGKRIFFNYFLLAKIVLLVFIWIPLAVYLLIFIYAIESLLLFLGRYKRPVWTKKTILLASIALVVALLYLLIVRNIGLLLIFDILIPLIISTIVLLVQPFFVVMRNKILQKAKEKMAQRKDITVIGITGSFGKTSTKEFLTTILSTHQKNGGQAKYKVLSTKEHRNSEIGIAQTILEELKPEHEVFVVEMGAYKKGGIKLLCNMVKPKIGMVTGVNEQHLATFGSMENLLSAEGGRELVQQLPKDGLLVLNGDNKYCLDLYKTQTHVPVHRSAAMIYSLDAKRVKADIWAEEVSVHEDHLDFMVMTQEKNAEHFTVKVLGKQNIQNLLGAILVVRHLGMSLSEISNAAKNITQGQAGIMMKRGVNGTKVIDSSYSSNPDGVIADLEYLKIFNVKKVVVMPCLIELGSKSAEVHQNIGKKIAEVCDLAIITTKDKFKELKRGATLAGMLEKNIILCEKPEEVFHQITTFCKAGDAVLLEGRVPNELIKLLIKQ